ncbi:virB8 family protein [Yersinia pseudotuberculosis]|uniref:virB8 family protein n=1 Tax=Yersinia pseudotuberculosis TaxID=633 RepID=UPI0005E308E4|nr:type IV secretion system protein [Yersinia pseudotuberculosis]BET64941.1 type IV secretion system protein [Yersinia pseudotuberculosis]CNM04290.1 TriG protein [Yersinia pseudotuberculosis]
MSKTKQLINASKTFEEKLLTRDARDKKVGFFIGGTGLLMGVFGIVAVIMLLPLKETELELYTVDNTTGRVEKITHVKQQDISSQEALAKSLAANYVKSRERYNYFSLQRDYDTVQLFGTDEVNAEYMAIYNSKNSPDVVYQKAAYVVDIDIISNVISSATLPDYLAQIRFKKTTRRVLDGNTKVEYWNARFTYRYVPDKALTEEQREANPLGFTVTSYQRDKEIRGE